MSSTKNIFTKSVYSNAVLHVTETALNDINNAFPWGLFEHKESYIPGTESVGMVATDEDSVWKVFDINGLYVSDSIDSLPKGLYILRKNNMTKKVVKHF